MTASPEDERVAIYRALLDRQSQEDQGIRDACSALLDGYSAENRDRLRALLEERLKTDEMLETARKLIRVSEAEPVEAADAFGRRKNTPLTLLGYRTGALAAMKRNRRRRLRAIWKADFGSVLSADQFEASDAGSYGSPASQERLSKMIGELRWNGYQQSKMTNEDSARHFTEDAEYLESLLEEESGSSTQD